MHLYVLARGKKELLEKWLNDLNAQYMPWKHQVFGDREGMINLAVREVKLIEISFPEEGLSEVLKIVRPEKNDALKRKFWFVRRILGCDRDVPEYDVKGVSRGDVQGIMGTRWSIYKVYREGVDVSGIGIRHDKRDEHGTEML